MGMVLDRWRSPQPMLGMVVAMKKIFLAGVAVLALAGTASAAECIVSDPTGTPLNVRSRPNGTILGALHNDTRVTVINSTIVSGKVWSKVVPIKAGKTGWVFHSYLDCPKPKELMDAVFTSWYAIDHQCFVAEDPTTDMSCLAREDLAEMLSKRGYCFGKEGDEMHLQMNLHKCTKGSLPLIGKGAVKYTDEEAQK
jgi:hypothetical protein